MAFIAKKIVFVALLKFGFDRREVRKLKDNMYINMYAVCIMNDAKENICLDEHVQK